MNSKAFLNKVHHESKNSKSHWASISPNNSWFLDVFLPSLMWNVSITGWPKEDCLYLDTGPPCPKLSEPKFSVTFVPEKDASARDMKHLEIFRPLGSAQRGWYNFLVVGIGRGPGSYYRFCMILLRYLAVLISCEMRKNKLHAILFVIVCTSLCRLVKLWPFRKCPTIIRSSRPGSIIPLHHLGWPAQWMFENLKPRFKEENTSWMPWWYWFLADFECFDMEINLVLSITQEWLPMVYKKYMKIPWVHCSLYCKDV